MHQLERKIHVAKQYVWHSQWMMMSLDLTHCSHWGSLETGCDLNQTCYTFQFILNGRNRGLWHIPGLFWYIKHRLFDQISFKVIDATLSHVTCATHLLRSAHEICKYLKSWKSLKIKSQKCWICDFQQVVVVLPKFVCYLESKNSA